MFVKNFSHISRVDISESKKCFNVKSTTYYFHRKAKILAGFQICINLILKPIKIICYGIRTFSVQSNFTLLFS